MPDVRLCIPQPDDVAAVVEAVTESLPELLPWMGWVHPGYGEADAAGWIAVQTDARSAGTAWEFLVVNAAGRVLGSCGINQVNPVHRFANLGYWIRSSEAGRGVAVEAVRLLRDWAFAETPLLRLELVVARGNVRSERVAEKSGAVREGVLRSRLLVHGAVHDATMFSLVRSP
jgi:ribosomal-protein-serine acetyltransferase